MSGFGVLVLVSVSVEKSLEFTVFTQLRIGFRKYQPHGERVSIYLFNPNLCWLAPSTR
jgi:hypothetical protein